MKDGEESPHSMFLPFPSQLSRLSAGVSEEALGLGGHVLDSREHLSVFSSVHWGSG